jgi:hypothetical protein
VPAAPRIDLPVAPFLAPPHAASAVTTQRAAAANSCSFTGCTEQFPTSAQRVEHEYHCTKNKKICPLCKTECDSQAALNQHINDNCLRNPLSKQRSGRLESSSAQPAIPDSAAVACAVSLSAATFAHTTATNRPIFPSLPIPVIFPPDSQLAVPQRGIK